MAVDDSGHTGKNPAAILYWFTHVSFECPDEATAVPTTKHLFKTDSLFNSEIEKGRPSMTVTNTWFGGMGLRNPRACLHADPQEYKIAGQERRKVEYSLFDV